MPAPRRPSQNGPPSPHDATEVQTTTRHFPRWSSTVAHLSVLWALIALAPVVAAQDTAQPPAPATLIYCGGLLDIPGQPPRGASTILVRDGRIETIREGRVVIATADGEAAPTIIDLGESFVLPGLIDCHTHITGEYSRDGRLRRVVETDADAAIASTVFARRTLEAGFTTIRNVGSSGDAAFALRDAIARGIVPGPRVLVAGSSITPTGGHSDETLGYRDELFDVPGASAGVGDGPAACRQAVRAQVKRGADVIKLTATGGVLSNTAAGVEQQFFADELAAIVETGHLLGRKVCAHAHGTTGILAALRAGVDSIEHGTYLDDTAIALFIDTGAFLVPTIHAGKFVEEKAREDGYFPAPVRPKAAAVGPAIQSSFGRAYKAGVRIAFGTDVGVGKHGTNALEFVYMTEAGMPNDAAIVSATLNAAELCGLADQIGSLEPGKQADLIAVPRSPLDDITALQDIRFVMKGGTVHVTP